MPDSTNPDPVPFAINTRFGCRTIVEYRHNAEGEALAVCRCHCGRLDEVPTSRLPSVRERQCRDCARAAAHHGQKPEYLSPQGGTPEYRAWRAMIARTHDPNMRFYANYGGRGIGIEPAWHNFANFLRDMGPKPSPKHSLERLDSNGDYSKANCVWATRKEQNNNARHNRVLEFRGQRMTVAQWADALGVQKQLLYDRLHRGWSVERALTEPKNPSGYFPTEKRINHR